VTTGHPAVTIRAAWSPGEVRVAAVADGVLTDYALWRPGSPDGVGDVYRGRVTAVVPGMAGAFVSLASGMQDGFLPDSEGTKGLTEGAIVTVRIVRAAHGGKGPRLSARVERGEEGPAGLRRRGDDPLRELAVRYPAARIMVDDPALAAELRPDMGNIDVGHAGPGDRPGDRIALVPAAFDDAIETEVESLTSSEITLASGVSFSVHPTPALVAIDVDAGGALTGREGTARRHFALNTSVLPELARQIRLRNLSGAILIDLAGMKVKQRTSLGPALAAALMGDPVRPRFLGFTVLGLAEIVRPRVRAPLHEVLSGPYAAGLLALRAIARSTRAEPGRRLTLRASPAVIAALDADPVAMADLARITGQRLNSHSDPSFPGDGWRIEDVPGEAMHG
jgi:Ribonuclease G/E